MELFCVEIVGWTLQNAGRVARVSTAGVKGKTCVGKRQTSATVIIDVSYVGGIIFIPQNTQMNK